MWAMFPRKGIFINVFIAQCRAGPPIGVGALCCRGVHREIHMVAEQTEKGYGEVGEAHWAPGEVGGVVEAVENAPKLSIG